MAGAAAEDRAFREIPLPKPEGLRVLFWIYTPPHDSDSLASHPCKKRKSGPPLQGWRRQKVKGGPPALRTSSSEQS